VSENLPTAENSGFTFAFQPIVDAVAKQTVSYEALVRGLNNEPAGVILDRVPADKRYEFDQRARIEAIRLAARLAIPCLLNLNLMPQSLLTSPESMESTLEAANRVGTEVGRIVIEVVEGEMICCPAEFIQILNRYRALGVKVAIDDFGAGYSGLNLLAEFQPDQVKLDMQLIRGIESHGPRQAIVRAIGQICLDLGIELIAEGVETTEEYSWLRTQGIYLFQGYLFARPGFQSLPAVEYPGARSRQAA
jgi:EAL domain-containing protein (putative c-di-GMP-specific phosphodiesterase class I)